MPDLTMTALTVFHNDRIKNERNGSVLPGEDFTAPDEIWARDAERLGLAEMKGGSKLPEATQRAPDGKPVGVASIARPNDPIPSTAQVRPKKPAPPAPATPPLLPPPAPPAPDA